MKPNTLKSPPLKLIAFLFSGFILLVFGGTFILGKLSPDEEAITDAREEDNPDYYPIQYAERPFSSTLEDPTPEQVVDMPTPPTRSTHLETDPPTPVSVATPLGTPLSPTTASNNRGKQTPAPIPTASTTPTAGKELPPRSTSVPSASPTPTQPNLHGAPPSKQAHSLSAPTAQSPPGLPSLPSTPKPLPTSEKTTRIPAQVERTSRPGNSPSSASRPALISPSPAHPSRTVGSTSQTSIPIDAPLQLEMVNIPPVTGTNRTDLIKHSRYLLSVGELNQFLRAHDEPLRTGAPDTNIASATWEEAVAFTAWLTMEQRKTGLISNKTHYRLPTSKETKSLEIWKHDDEPDHGSTLRPVGVVLAKGARPKF